MKKTNGMPPPGLDKHSIRRQLITVDDACKSFNVIRYRPGSNNLWVFVNGKKEFCDLDYDEVNATRIAFKETVPRGTVIEIIVFPSYK